MALRALKPRKSMRHIKDRLAVGAGELDLRRIDAVRGHVRRPRRSESKRALVMCLGPAHQLRRKHLRQLTRAADELRDPGRDGEDLVAAGAPHLDASDGAGGAGGRELRRDRRLLLLLSHGGGSEIQKPKRGGGIVKARMRLGEVLRREDEERERVWECFGVPHFPSVFVSFFFLGERKKKKNEIKMTSAISHPARAVGT